MAKKIYLLLLLISVLMYTGCGGGGGGKKKKINPPVLGTIQGTVSFGPAPASRISNSTITLSKSVFFSKAAIRRTNFVPQSVQNEKIVKLRSNVNANEVIAKLGGRIKKKLYGTVSTYLIEINDQTFSKSTATRFSEVEYIEDNLIFQALAVPDDPKYIAPYYWNYKMLNLEKAWGVQKGENVEPDKEVIVAVLDTGIALNHEDFIGSSKSNLLPGQDVVNKSYDGDPSDNVYLNEANQLSHGTHVAGIIGAVTDNKIGIAGVAWNVKIMPIRVLNSEGWGVVADIIEGINWAVTNKANVINLSLGAAEATSEVLKTAINNALNANVTVIAAAGNEGTSVTSPANYSPVIAVASLDHTCSRPSYSNFGPEIDFCAPGGGIPLTQYESEWAVKTIFSTCYDKLAKKNTYAYMAGTSQAAPHISGLAALLYAQNQDITPLQVEEQLKKYCIDLGSPGHDNYYGHGMPDAYAVLKNDTTPPEMANVKIFIGTPEGTIISNLQHVGASGDFTVSGIKAGTYYICSFEDTDNNNLVTAGEKFSYTQVTLVENATLTGVNLSL